MAMEEPEPSGVVPPPTCKAILLCDSVIFDAFTGYYSAIGIFDVFVLPSFPGETRSFVAYLQLTDGIGEYSMALEIHDLKDDTIVARAEGKTMRFKDRPSKVHLIINAPPLSLSHPGVYEFVVKANDQVIDHQRFLAISPEEPNDDEEGAEDPGEG